MKTPNYILTAAILLTSSVITIAANSDKIPGATVQDAAFFTGKPYDADLESYVFNYRNYNVEMGRWTTSDITGFPDGANNQVYAPIPTTQIDYLGAFSYTVPTANKTYKDPASGLTMSIYDMTAVSGASYMDYLTDGYRNCTFSLGGVVEGFTLNTYKAQGSGTRSGNPIYGPVANLDISFATTVTGVNTGWIQLAEKTDLPLGMDGNGKNTYGVKPNYTIYDGIAWGGSDAE